MEFLLALSCVNIILRIVGKIRVRKLHRKYKLDPIKKTGTLKRVKGILLCVVPILNIVGFIVLVIIVYCDEHYMVEALKKIIEKRQ